MRFAFAMLVLLGLAAIEGRDASADDNSSLDDALLEDLGAELLKPAQLKPSQRDPTTQLDERLLEQLGEDVGKSNDSKADRWTRVVERMQLAHKLLKRPEPADEASTAQAEALVGLDAMIAELTERKSQCSGGNCNKPGSPQPNSKPGGKPKPSAKAGKNPATAASSTTSSGADLSTELAVAGELVKDLWGKLPQRQREQILQPLSEEFLPKYASEIEDYFRSLARPKGTDAQSP